MAIGKYWQDVLAGQSRTVAVGMKRLRRLLKASEDAAQMLRSIYEVGYPEHEEGKAAVVERLRALETMVEAE